MPGQIEDRENALARLREETSTSDFYRRPFEETQPVLEELQRKESELEALMDRWLQLEEQQEAFDRARAAKTDKNCVNQTIGGLVQCALVLSWPSPRGDGAKKN